MSRTSTPLAVAADYADALMTARRAKNGLFLLVLLLVVGELTVFLLARYDVLKLVGPVADGQPTLNAAEVLRYALPFANFLIVVLSLLLAVVMLLLMTIMLVGRLIGVSHVTGAFLWSVGLLFVLFPWQTLLVSEDRYDGGSARPSVGVVEQPAAKWFGSTYTYTELMRHHKFADKPIFPDGVFGWGRYVGWPMLSVVLLMIVQVKSSKGLRFALGEADVHVEMSGRSDISVSL
jgi:hypothetical protein